MSINKRTQAFVNQVLKRAEKIQSLPVGIFIVKIQQSLLSTERKRQMLVYNKDKSVMYQADLTPDVQLLLNNRPKAYFNAEIVDTRIQVLDEVEAQTW